MKQFVIEITHTWKDKEGNERSAKSYFQKHTGFPFPMNLLSNLEGCKKYGSRAAALIDWRKYYRYRKGAKVTELKTQNTQQ